MSLLKTFATLNDQAAFRCILRSANLTLAENARVWEQKNTPASAIFLRERENLENSLEIKVFISRCIELLRKFIQVKLVKY